MINPIDEISNFLTIDQAAEQLAISPGKVKRLIEEHNLIALRRDGKLMIPAELIIDGEPLPSLRGTIILLLDSGYTLDEAISWLYTPSDVLGSTPIASLLQGRKAPVRRLAQMVDL
ncbi:MAG: Rv2175c family DNA-binding protein [Actinomycetota bacterium]